MRTSVKQPSETRIGETPKFPIDCFPFIFSFEELEVLENKGYLMKDLAEGVCIPTSNDEKSFVKVIKGEKQASSLMEIAWVKFCNRFQLEASLLETEELYQEYVSKHRH
jgi:uncharacterized protein YifE (UPF0438 family)